MVCFSRFLFLLITEVREVMSSKTDVVVKWLEHVLESQKANPGFDRHFYTQLMSLRNDITNFWSLVSDTYVWEVLDPTKQVKTMCNVLSDCRKEQL